MSEPTPTPPTPRQPDPADLALAIAGDFSELRRLAVPYTLAAQRIGGALSLALGVVPKAEWEHYITHVCGLQIGAAGGFLQMFGDRGLTLKAGAPAVVDAVLVMLLASQVGKPAPPAA